MVIERPFGDASCVILLCAEENEPAKGRGIISAFAIAIASIEAHSKLKHSQPLLVPQLLLPLYRPL